jgi:hypothetical protein
MRTETESGLMESCQDWQDRQKRRGFISRLFRPAGMVSRKVKTCQLSRGAAKLIAENVARFSGYGTEYAFPGRRG